MKKITFFRSPDADTDTASTTPKTDNTKLTTTDTVYVSTDGGTTNEAFPKTGVEYDFCVDVSNLSDLASGAFYVEFKLDDGNGNVQTFKFDQDAGLDTQQSVKAVAHFGSFATGDKNSYTLSACIYAPSAPETPINCAGTFNFWPDQNNTSTDTSNSSSTDTPSGADPSASNTSNASANSSSGTSGSFDAISYDVPLIPQPNKVACWAASMAMILSYKKQQSISPETLANEVGSSLRTSYSWDLLKDVRDHYGFTSVINVPSDACVYYPPQQWHDWLKDLGPLWFTFIWSTGGSHALVIKGISGDGTPEGTVFDIQNPWDITTTFDSDVVDFTPFNSGTSQQMPFLDFAKTFGDLGYDSSHADFRIMYLP